MLLYRHDWSCSLLAVAFSIAQLTTKCSASSRNQTDDGSVFINEIFQLYGKRNATFITQAKFASMLHQLTLGNVYVEKLDKFCLYKGVHNGYREEPSKTDGVVNSQGLHGGEKLVRERRSGDHSKKDKHIEDPKHNEHLQNHLKHCLSRKRLLQRYNMSDTDPLSKDDFLRICPALIQQLNAGFCLHRHNCSEKPYYLRISVKADMVWAYGFVAITVVSLASLCIIAVIPCLEKGFYQRIMGYLVALAVGTLAGDALLHLIPHAFESLLSTSEEEHKHNIWKSCFVLLGMYAFFLVEQIMKAKKYLGCCNKKEKPPQQSNDLKEIAEKSDLADVKFKDLNDKGSGDQLHSGSCSFHGSPDAIPNNASSSGALSDTELLPYPPAHVKTTNNHNHDPHEHFEYHDHHEVQHDLEHNHGHSHGTIGKDTSIATVAWMVIVGDGFHNFSDGLAIGAAFAASYSSGISTTIAVFCHELPHELGDFAVLIKSGMSIKQAICYNLVSAVLSYIGLVIGILVGNYSADGRQFALALTAGLFLYVALATMLPELTSSVADDVGDLWTFISPHIGIISGIAIMLLISIYEDKF